MLVSDTVGFIKNLPHGLVASFKSTLDEALDARCCYVIDASDPGFVRQLEVTDKVLEEIEADHVPRIRVFNKIDHVGDAAAQAECAAALQAQYPGCVVSARRPDDVTQLHQTIVAFSSRIWSRRSCSCPGRRNTIYAAISTPTAWCWKKAPAKLAPCSCAMRATLPRWMRCSSNA